MLVLENTVYLSTFVKMFLCNIEEIYEVYLSVFLNVCNIISSKDKIKVYAPFNGPGFDLVFDI